MMEYKENDFNFLPYLAGRAFLDPAFREQLLKDPELAAAGLGLHLTERQIEKLGSLDEAMINEWVAGFERTVGQPIMAMSAW